jgi:protein O-GlcNAc transferase
LAHGESDLGPGQQGPQSYGRGLGNKRSENHEYVAVDLVRHAADLLNQGRWGDAQAAAARLPPSAQASQLRGAIAAARGDWGRALRHFRRALRIEPLSASAAHSAGVALRRLGRLEEALDHLQNAVRSNAAAPEFPLELGDALFDAGRFGEARRAFLRAERDGADPRRTLPRIARTFDRMGRLHAAGALWMEFLRRFPRNPAGLTSLAGILLQTGRPRDGYRALRRAIAAAPAFLPARSNLLLSLHYSERRPAALVAEQQRHAGAFAIKGAAPPPARPLQGRRLRIGYVSGDFRDHSVASFFAPLLRAHDPSRVQVFCYSNVARPDTTTARLRALAGHWRPIEHLDDDRAARLVSDDHIDVLVDLSGHTNRNRLPLFARRPAPLQVSYIGYPDDTGLEAIEYRLTDALSDPEPGRHLFLEPCFLCYAPPQVSPPIQPLPVLRRGFITFGCFAVRPKLSPEILALWARILRKVPGSRLLLKSQAYADPQVRRDLTGFFVDRGIAAGRIRLRTPLPGKIDHLALYRQVDIALDTFPYAGTATTCEALWMGIPVVTLAGRHHASRVGLSLLSAIGHPELVAPTRTQYVNLATGLAADPHRLGRLHSALRTDLAGSPLMDAPALARQLEDLLIETFRRRVAATSGGTPLPGL